MSFESLTLDALSQYVQNINQETLLLQTKTLVEKERELTAKTLVFFREIENRLIHIQMGFNSLFDMLVNHFKFSDGSASRRVAAIRVLAQVPEVKDKIESGELSLSVVASTQRFFNAEAKNEKPLDIEEKREILNSLVGKSAREAEKELLQKSSVPLTLQVPDEVKQKGAEHVKISFLAPQSLADLLEEAKGLLAHRLPVGASLAEVVQALAEIGIEKIKKERFGVGARERKEQTEKKEANSTKKTDVEVKQERSFRSSGGVTSARIREEMEQRTLGKGNIDAEARSAQRNNDVDVEVKSTKSEAQKSKRSRYIPLPVRRAVFERAGGKCEYRDPLTQRRCNSSKYLQLHHTTAFAKGGEHIVEGLACFCSHHNKLAAVNDFGAGWMSQFQKAPSWAS